MMTYHMWGHGNCAGIPSLPNYEKAKTWFDGVVPIRGRTEEVRPLGKVRRFAWYRIQKNQRVIEDGFLGQYITTYSCRLYGTDCIEYFPDGKIAIRTNGWHTPTTMAFINYATQEFGYIESVGGKWYWKQKGLAVTEDGNKGKMFLMSKLRDDPIILMPDADGNMIVQNPVQEKKYVANRKAMNVVRKNYEFFREYCYVMLSMNEAVNRAEVEAIHKKLRFEGSSLIGNERWRTDDRITSNRNNFFRLMDKVKREGDIELMYSLALVATWAFGHWSYGTNTSVCTPEKFNREWAELLKHKFFAEVMVATDVEAGVGFKDPNLKYL